MNFHDTVNEASERGGRVAKASETCEAIKVCASPTLILNISDGHNHGVLNVNEDDELMNHLRLFAVENYHKAWEEIHG